ncbi:MAG TPA: hypothetical protein VKI40_01460 [Terriglobales bacterium]|nr:hypothetical protein [Terriglobales bacterium]
MTLLSCARTAAIVCAISLAPSLSYSAAETKSRIYSNVEFNEEGGDLLGYELEIQLDGSRVTGILRIYEGGCGTPAPVVGTLSRGKISLRGDDKFYGKVESERNDVQRPGQGNSSHGEGSKTGDHQTETYS